MELKYWVLSGVVAVLLAVLGWILASIAQNIVRKLDKIVEELQRLTSLMTKHEQQIEHIYDRLKEHDRRLTRIEEE
jgi:predicted PurR-regulated permease PerM